MICHPFPMIAQLIFSLGFMPVEPMDDYIARWQDLSAIGTKVEAAQAVPDKYIKIKVDKFGCVEKVIRILPPSDKA